MTRGRVLARALRLLFAQLKFLKLDAANAHLRMLTRTMGRDQAVECAPAPCCKVLHQTSASYTCSACWGIKAHLPRPTRGCLPCHNQSSLPWPIGAGSINMAYIAQVCSANLRKAMEAASGCSSRRGCRPPAPHAGVACSSIRSAAAR